MDYDGPFLHDAGLTLQHIVSYAVPDIVGRTRARGILFRSTAVSIWERELADFAQSWCEDTRGKDADVPSFLAETRQGMLDALRDGDVELVDDAAAIVDDALRQYFEKVRRFRYSSDYLGKR